ncbi:unnamed protein product [Microthlaspi erraticum]|uniref:Reverse transcriptase Ty1/copia-type domain-containing protein n=1 Tax=Microthlaspi erraticum TaxID=1685480 RepID=A0A6D2JJ40_9BRAS|nr:unnamed protein product [Microthlaspi erraticum]
MLQRWCVCSYQAKPKQSHLQAVKKILRMSRELSIWGSSTLKDPTEILLDIVTPIGQDVQMIGKVQVEVVSSLGTILIAWLNKKQNSVSLSTAEAEYIALGSCCTQLIWMRQMSADYGWSLDPSWSTVTTKAPLTYQRIRRQIYKPAISKHLPSNEVATTTSLVVTADCVSEPAEPEVQQTDASMSVRSKPAVSPSRRNSRNRVS